MLTSMMNQRPLCFLLSSALCIFSLIGAISCCETQLNNSLLSSKSWSFEAKIDRIRRWFPRLAWPSIVAISNVNINNSNISQQCKSALKQYYIDIRTGDKKALSIHDAGGKFRPGFISRIQQSDFGFYEQCPLETHAYYFIEFDWPLPEYSKVGKVKLNISGTWLSKLNDVLDVYYHEKQVTMACLPLQCLTLNYETMAREFTAYNAIPLRVAFKRDDLHSDFVSQSSYFKYCSLAILLAFSAFVLSSTVVRLFQLSMNPIVNAMNMVENTTKLFQQSENHQAKELAFVNGYRLFYAYVGLVSHVMRTAHIQFKYAQAKSIAYDFTMLQADRDSSPAGAFYTRTGFMIVGLNFTLSGIFAYYSWALILTATKGRVSFMKFAFVRYIRSIPVIIFTLLIVMAFPVSFGSGPVYRTTFNTITRNCLDNGWAELVALSDFFNVDKIALPQAWFVSADIQIYLLSYFAIIMLYKRPKVGFVTE